MKSTKREKKFTPVKIRLQWPIFQDSSSSPTKQMQPPQWCSILPLIPTLQVFPQTQTPAERSAVTTFSTAENSLKTRVTTLCSSRALLPVYIWTDPPPVTESPRNRELNSPWDTVSNSQEWLSLLPLQKNRLKPIPCSTARMKSPLMLITTNTQFGMKTGTRTPTAMTYSPRKRKLNLSLTFTSNRLKFPFPIHLLKRSANSTLQTTLLFRSPTAHTPQSRKSVIWKWVTSLKLFSYPVKFARTLLLPTVHLWKRQTRLPQLLSPLLPLVKYSATM